ncbi:hypothetical protein SK854_32785 [Lentzea sp. BCCO 10_0061]|uniref:Uncharacterized protein n=1 Tax=Lentzea sokolovensis TaxID=3095429 RepID=A0ABU4V577_9PSEU|nr:hypothetical protein [Lentzea sp. BCCO 10_0061]MDX8146931.1 hypothetical protein [Lentzea sp. BCCO 10_0061]
MGRSRALLIGVGDFATLVPEGEEPGLGQGLWPRLDFADEVTSAVEAALERLDYEITTLRNPDRPKLVSAITKDLDDDNECLFVHVVSHGDIDEDDDSRLDVIPACGRTGLGTNVSEWVSTAQARGGTPVLFMLDLCRSGRAARLPWLAAKAGNNAKAWVIASAGPDEDAFDGRFSRSVATVLSQLAVDGLGTDPSRPFVSFQTVARRIAEQVEVMPGFPQRVHATPIDPAQPVPELPFFPNPLYADNPQRRARQAIEAPLRGFLDELDDVFDPEHFLSRVGTHFTGRRRQLRELTLWMDGGAPTSGLRVVTGSPGVGKSALLGMLVCAAHPVLADAVPHIRGRLEAAAQPSRNHYLGAVHARQRTCDEIVASLGRQFGLVEPFAGWSSRRLIRELSELPVTPVIVVDAVDEALDPVRVVTDLLIPLATAEQLDGGPVCRLLVGLRPWDEFALLRNMAAASRELLDLDKVGASEFRKDVKEYVATKLADLENYALAGQRAVREQLARTIAGQLVPESKLPAEWGAFLVAGLFAEYLDSRAAATTKESARRLGEVVPRSLPGVLELELGARPDRTRLRATLAVLAHAKGDGMPIEVLELLLEESSGRQEEDVRELLHAGRFYLRTTVERDGTTLYRLVHQSLADYLRLHPVVESAAASPTATAVWILDVLLEAVRGGRWKRWTAAPPYVMRHAVHHAIDAGCVDELLTNLEFLVHATPAALRPELHHASTLDAVEIAKVYEAATDSRWQPDQIDHDMRRWVLGLEAARLVSHELGRRFARVGVTEGWQPRWFRSSGLPDGRWITALACAERDGEPVVLSSGSDGSVELRHLVSGAPVSSWPAAQAGHVSAVATIDLDVGPAAVTGGADGVLRIHDLATGEALGEIPARSGWINAIACVRLGKQPIAAVCADDAVRLWNLRTRKQHGKVSPSHRWGRAIACATDAKRRPIAVTVGNDHAVRVWSMKNGSLICPPARAHCDRVYAVACHQVRGRQVAVTGGDDDRVLMSDMVTGETVGTPMSGHTRLISSLVCTEIAGRPVAISGSFDRTIRVWDLLTASCRNTYVMPKEVHALAIAPDGGLIVASGKDLIVFDWFEGDVA